MTSEPAQPDRTMIPYRYILPKEYTFPDPEPAPDSMRASPIVARCGYTLQDHFNTWGRDDVYIGSGGFQFWFPQCPNAIATPDLFVAFGVKFAVFPSVCYNIWDDNPPDLVLEVASGHKDRFGIDDDINRKPGLYALLGIGEYWRFDSTGGDYYGYHLAGDILINGEYQPIPLTTEPDGMVWGYSPALDLSLCANFAEWGDRLRFYDAKAGAYLRNTQEANAAIAERDREIERLNEEIHRLRA